MGRSGMSGGLRIALIAMMLFGAWLPGVARSAEPSRPNILIFVTDDQRADGTMGVMPKTEAWFKNGGMWFPNGFVTTPLCCPARASIFTGLFAHNHGVRRNADPDAVQAMDQGRTMERYLHDAAYNTGIAGKFLNTWSTSTAPPYFDKWFTGQAYWFGSTYNTVRLGDLALSYLNEWNATDDQDPWFLYIAPKAPHDPFDAEPQHAQAAVPSWPGNPGQFEADRSDKPQWVRSASTTPTDVENVRVAQLRTLMSVDDLVDRVMSHLEAIGEGNTLAFFLSDNGYFWGEHGISQTKRLPYLESVKVPFGMRWPGHVPAGVTDPRMVANIDIAPTALEAAGLAPPASAPMDGISLLSGSPRQRLHLEFFRSQDSPKWPSWASTLTPSYQYIEWYEDDLQTVSFREYYDLAQDPWELTNLLGDYDGSNDPDLAPHVSVLASDRVCSGLGCQGQVISDTEAPTAPTNLTAQDLGASGVQLGWGPSTDNVGVAGYEVLRDGAVIATIGPVVAYTDASAPTGTLTYTVRAFDQAGYRSPPSNAVQITRAPPPPPPPPSGSSVFTDNFETGNMAKWPTAVRTTVQSSIMHAGTYAVRLTASGLASYARANLPSTEPSVLIRLWTNVIARPPSGAMILARAQGSSAPLVRLLLNANGTLSYNNEVAKVWRNSSTVLPSGGWHLLELEMTVGTSGHIRVLLDGVVVPGLDRTENLGTAGMQKIQIGDHIKNRTYDVVTDDVEVLVTS